MTKVGILTEKPSAARNFAAALGGKTGSHSGVDYVIVNARGHLLEFKDPSEMVGADLADRYKAWDLAHLPWDAADFSWEREVRRVKGKADPDAKALLDQLKKTLSGCDEITIASDLDPTGEGDLLAWEIIDYLELHRKRFTRMEFLDEAPASIQKAFAGRRAVTSMETEPGYRKAHFRSRWDLLSMQFTRASTKVSGASKVLRNGRLKSAMVVLVGDQLAAHNNYVKKPFFENRFRDENGIVYSDPETDRFESAEQVPGGLHASPVVKDGVSRKKTTPPKLMDLAGLSALLSKKGHPAKKVLEIYQKMYEAQIVSYPRTEDKFVSTEQFNEMLPLVDKIARLVGVDPAVLTVRTPRKTHVKNGGAHGANRPGTNVPASLAAIENDYGKLGREIYEVLARNYLTMLAPDYEYDQHRGHVKDYPSYTGTLNVPAVLGWKGVFDLDAATAEDDAETEDGAGATELGTTAQPFVHEGYPPRPAHPSMTWLMKQLEKRSVGTGATRTSTYAEVTNNSTGRALMVEKRGGKLVLSEAGELNHHIVAGTNIGDLGLTERVFGQMAAVADGSGDADAFLGEVAGLVDADIATMGANVKKLPKEFTDRMTKAGLAREQVETFEVPQALWFSHGDKVAKTARRVFSGHRFTDDEVAALCRGEKIEITATSAKNGNEFTCGGKLVGSVFTAESGKQYPRVAFAPEFTPRTDQTEVTWKGKKVRMKSKAWGANEHWAGHDFTAAEIETMVSGGEISFEAVSSKGNAYTAKGTFGESNYKGAKVYGFQLSIDKNRGKGASGGGARNTGARKPRAGAGAGRFGGRR